MRSLGQLLGDRFFDLLEGNAAEARRSVELLSEFLKSSGRKPDSLEAIQKDCQRLASIVETELAQTVMASLKKDDIEAVSVALRKIPALVQRVAERVDLGRAQLSETDLTLSAETMVKAFDALAKMVAQLRKFDNQLPIREFHAQANESCDAAEKALELSLHNAYRSGQQPLDLVVLKDIIENAEALVEHCRDTAELLSEIVLKYS